MSTTPPTKADAFLVSCIDPRVTDDTAFIMAALGRTARYSEMRIAGGALAAVDPSRSAWATALWDNLDLSRAVHGIRKVTFVAHRDCAAVNAWAGRRLTDDPAEEMRIHAEVLNSAADAVRQRHPGLLVEIKLMEFDGQVHVLPCASCVPSGFRAEAVGAAAQAIATASIGTGATLDATSPTATEADAAGFADLLRLRLSGARTPTPSDDLALLSQGVTRYGLSAREARAIRESVAASAGQQVTEALDRDVATFLRTRADRHGRVDKSAVKEAAGLYRRLGGLRETEAESRSRVAQIAQAEGLTPRPSGLWPFRSARWLSALAQPR